MPLDVFLLSSNTYQGFVSIYNNIILESKLTIRSMRKM